MTGYIYSISDKNDVVFYIGSSIDPESRIKQHIFNNKEYDFVLNKFVPIDDTEFNLGYIDELEFANRRELLDLEIYWIHQFRAWGFFLRNSVIYKHRKKEYDNPNNNPFPLRLGELREPLELEAKRLGKSISWVINKILEDYVRERNLKIVSNVQ